MTPLRILHLTPGTGNFHCGSCLRDNALVLGLRARGHDALMVPLYLPQVVDEPAAAPDTPIFLGGISVFLDQQYPWLHGRPQWIDRALSSPGLLRQVARFAGLTSPRQLGESTVSMLRGEDGAQARELGRMLEWLRGQPRFDAICLSNCLLAGLARRLKAELGAPVLCTLQGEDSFLDGLPEPFRTEAWHLLAERCRDIDHFAAVSGYFRNLMRNKLALDGAQVSVVYPGIDLDAFVPAPAPPTVPTIGYLARLHPAKGLDTLVEAFILLRQNNRVPDCRLRIAGAMTDSDRGFVAAQQRRLAEAGCPDAVDWQPNLPTAAKADFLRSLSVFSVPALYGEAFGLYVIEALAAGVPVVQPCHAAFIEVLNVTACGPCFQPGGPPALADALAAALDQLDRRRTAVGQARECLRTEFTVQVMAEHFERRLYRTIGENV